MKKAVLFLMFAAISAQAGVISGAASDVKVAAKVASAPFRHPVKTGHAVATSVRVVFKSTKAAVKATAKAAVKI